MKLILTILIICSLGCTFEREVQIDQHILTLSKIDTMRRAFMFDELKITWLDEEHVKYCEFIIITPSTRIYKVGEIDHLKLRK